MQCSHPPALTEQELLDAFVADPADNVPAPLLQHLAECPSCRARLEQLQRFEKRIRAKLHPSADQIGDYYLNLLDEQQTTQVAQHITLCPHCRAELEILRKFMADTEDQVPEDRAVQPTPTPNKRPVQILRPTIQPLVYARGTSRSVVADTQGVTINVTFEHTNASNVVISGRVIADDQDAWAGAELTLSQSGVVRATALLDEMGAFRCQSSALGQAEVALNIASADGLTIVLESV